jgi:hypothetical protein
MQFTNDHAVLSDGKGASLKITRDTCRDFVYFRQLLRDSRKLDDNIGNTLNKIDSLDPGKCRDLMSAMTKMHKERLSSLEFCKNVLQSDTSNAGGLSASRVSQTEVIIHSPHSLYIYFLQ